MNLSNDTDIKRLCRTFAMSEDFAVLLGERSPFSRGTELKLLTGLKESVLGNGRGAKNERERLTFLHFYVRISA
jgi:hypothetical protein